MALPMASYVEAIKSIFDNISTWNLHKLCMALEELAFEEVNRYDRKYDEENE